MTGNLAVHRDPAWEGDAPIPSPPPQELGGTGQWPRMLKLSSEAEDRLADYLWDEINTIRIEKQQLIDDWIKWNAQYWATPAKKVKNFPFQKAANIVVPLTAIAVEAVVARLMNTIWAVEPFWSIRPKSDAWIEAAKPVERWLQTEVENENSLDVYDFSLEALTEFCILGTVVGKSGYDKVVRKSIRTLPDGVDVDNFQTVRDGATLDWVPLANFMMRVNETDPQEAAIVGEEHEFSWSQLKRMAGSGRMDPKAIEEIKTYWVHSREGQDAGDGSRYHAEVDKHASTEPHWNTVFKIQELWLGFDVDGDGWDEEIVVEFHHESRTFLSVRSNWYQDLHRPYRLTQYIKVAGRWVGIGIGKQNEQFQEEITTMHRQRLDNGTLANMRMIAVKKTSGYGPDEPVFPGKMWFLDDPNDIQPLQLSELYPSGFGNEEVTRRYSEMRTGVNEVLVGLPQEGTPGTATDTLARIEEGSKRFTLVLKSVRKWFGLLGLDVMSNYQEFGTGDREIMILGPEGEWVTEILRLPQQMIRNGAAVELTATDAIVNRQVEQQQWTTLATVVGTYYERALNLAITMVQIGLDPNTVIQIAQSALQANDEIIRRLLETYNVTGIDRMLLTSRKELPSGAPTGGPDGGPNRVAPEALPAGGLAGLAGANGSGAGRLGIPGNVGP